MIAQLDTVDGREDLVGVFADAGVSELSDYFLHKEMDDYLARLAKLVAEPNEHLRPGPPGEGPQPTWRWFGEVLLRAAQTMEGVRNAG